MKKTKTKSPKKNKEKRKKSITEAKGVDEQRKARKLTGKRMALDDSHCWELA